ncbi:MAG: histidinol-phosphate transaminase [Gammaproteobacteria bacterium]|nr:histidinol-phosphate transaminase [Gammaproteobacteria bacterium]
MSRFWSALVNQLTPYVPGEQPKTDNLIKLNTNENPYAPSPVAIKAMQGAANAKLRLYPDPESADLKACIADYYELKPQQVFIGNGSDEVLAHCFQALLKHEQPLLFPDITYSFYSVYSRLYQIEYQQIALADDFSICLDDYKLPNGGVIFANPNAPTGKLLALESIENFLQHNTQSVVVVDEAYIDFGGQSAVTLVDRYPNLVVIQTLSKSRSLAGLRVGFAIAQADLIDALERVKNSFNSYPMDRFSTTGAIAAINDHEYFGAQCDKIINSREWLTAQLAGIGFSIIPSKTNFLFVSHKTLPAGHIATTLRDKNIIVRHFNQPRIDNYLRITIGTQQECESLVAALNEIVI